MSELFSDEDGTTYLSEKERVLIENFRTLDSDQADALVQLSNVMKK